MRMADAKKQNELNGIIWIGGISQCRTKEKACDINDSKWLRLLKKFNVSGDNEFWNIGLAPT